MHCWSGRGRGETLYAANCNDYERRDCNRQIVRLAGKGVSSAELAERFELTTRSVRNILRDIPAETVRGLGE